VKYGSYNIKGFPGRHPSENGPHPALLNSLYLMTIVLSCSDIIAIFLNYNNNGLNNLNLRIRLKTTIIINVSEERCKYRMSIKIYKN
jgi:hypothetical protein